MGDVVVDISMSLDGFVTGPDPGPDNGLGTGGEPIHEWAFSADEADRQVMEAAVASTGAVLMGRRLFDIVDGPHGWNDDMGYGAERDQSEAPPNIVVTHSEPEHVRLAGRFRFAPSIEAAVEQGRALAGDKDVVIMGGGELCRGALAAGLVDGIRLHLAPILLGAGTPLFDGGSTGRLRQISVTPTSTATHLAYRVDR